MKSWSFWIILGSLLPSLIILTAETQGFTVNLIAPNKLILPVMVLIFTLLFLFNKFIIKPTEEFLKTIHRAIQGDYRARFSCTNVNDNFYKLSQTFNQFMSIVEQQTEELTKNRTLQSQLYENEKIYRSALELTCDRVFEADLTHNKLISGQETYAAAFPFLKSEIYDEVIKSIAQFSIYEEDIKNYLDTVNRANLIQLFTVENVTEVELEYRQKLENGVTQWMAATIIHLNNSSKSLKVIGYVKNIDQRKKQELEILNQSQKDGLTALYNKKATQSMIESYLSRKDTQSTSAVIMLDIDNFKNINDTLGHVTGDTALSQVGEKLHGLFRPVDIVGRIGGDEFLIFFNNYNSISTLINKLELLSSIFEEIHLDGDGAYQISGSIGVSLYPQDGNTYIELYQKADMALYYSKSRGKNCYNIYSTCFGEQSSSQLNHSSLLDLCRIASK